MHYPRELLIQTNEQYLQKFLCSSEPIPTDCEPWPGNTTENIAIYLFISFFVLYLIFYNSISLFFRTIKHELIRAHNYN